jgi:PhnB protein
MMHVALEFHGGGLFLSDDFANESRDPAMSSVFVRLDKPADVDALAARAKTLGATISQQPEDMFWGDRYARFTDPFGHQWQIGATKS